MLRRAVMGGQARGAHGGAITDPASNGSLIHGVLCPRLLQTGLLCKEWCQDNSPCTKKYCPEVNGSLPEGLGICLCTALSDVVGNNTAMCRLDNISRPVGQEPNFTGIIEKNSAFTARAGALLPLALTVAMGALHLCLPC